MAGRQVGLVSRIVGTPVLVLAFVSLAGVSGEEPQRGVAFGARFSAALQCQRPDDRCRGAAVALPFVAFRTERRHELFARFGFARGDALNDVTPLNISPWAADLEQTVDHVNGGAWNYLLTAWYRLRAGEFALTGGVIDAADYLDTNRYSNDEYTQFMNSVLVNGPNVFVPSYSPGLAAEWRRGRATLSGVYMHVGRQADESYDFFGAQLAYDLDTSAGAGTYRLLVDFSSPGFDAASGGARVRRRALLVSCDQQLGEGIGVFVRLSAQDDDALVDYGRLYSGGVDIRGSLWGRPRDNVGIGLAYLTGGNAGIERSVVAESYYRLGLGERFSVTGDLQYARDDRGSGSHLSGWVFGLRVGAQL